MAFGSFFGLNFLFGDRDGNMLIGGNGRDYGFGRGGDDRFFGGRGNDVFFGGRGFDTAVYSGSINDYSISRFGSRITKVQSLNNSVSDSGRDTLFSTEALYFEADDYTFFLNGTNNAVLAADDAVASGENGVSFAASDLLSNDQEFDGDAIEVTAVAATSASGSAVTLIDGLVSYNPGNQFDHLQLGETATDTFTYTVDDGKGGSDTATVTITIHGENDAPRIELPAALDVLENTTAVATVAATDVDSADLSYSISGTDAALFTIDEATGELNFIAAPDYETPADQNGDNSYDITVTVSDEDGGVSSQDVVINVQDVVEIPPITARINEIHYDNAGGDQGEFVEIRVNAGDDISQATVELYNGSNGNTYATTALADLEMTTDGEFDYYVWNRPTNGIQNGAPDGLALSNGGDVIEFLSYEGTLTANNGTAAGQTSTDIGVAENGGTEVGHSLQRELDGSWRAETEANTSGAANIQAPIAITDLRINEFHYDNAGGDQGEFVEIRVNAGADASGVTLELLNGSSSQRRVYRDMDLSEATVTSDGEFDYYVVATPGIQNGGPDGLALGLDGELVEFLSYEGTFTAVDGLAAGETSTDIGVFEPTDTEVGNSLQRGADDAWFAPFANTAGEANISGTSAVTDLRINEFHYDNEGGDAGEFVEIRVNSGADVSGLELEFVNGNNGSVYNSFTAAEMNVTTDGEFDYYVIELPENGLQNGGPDGLALGLDGELVEFISYEGTFTATDGLATGVTSTDVGVSESNSTSIGHSLQRDADGVFQAAAANTLGGENGSGGSGDGGTGGGDQPEIQLISTIQGTGRESTFVGAQTRVSAVVTKIESNGFWLQEEDSDADDNALTSEGIFVFSGGGVAVELGNLVEVTGTVDEFFGLTQIDTVTNVNVVNPNAPTPTAAQIILDPTTAQNFEAVEGMLVSVTSGAPDPLTVITNFNLDRFGQIEISAGVQYQPTQLFDAQTQADEIADLAQANENARLLLEDSNNAQNPSEFAYLPGGPGDNGNGILDAGDNFGEGGSTLRLGAEITAPVEGVLSFSFGNYQLRVTETLQIDEATNSGARQDAPADVGGDIQVASINVLNYFTTLDQGSNGTGPNGTLDPRGADTAEELVRQTEALVEMFQGTGAEAFAIQEIENNGFGEGSAIATLVDELNNAEESIGTYGFANPTEGLDSEFLGTDAITTGIIYDTAKLRLVHSEFIVFEEASAATTFDLAEPLNAVSSRDVGDFQRNRPSVAATFEDIETGETFTLVSSHFKSKGDSNLQDVVDQAQSAVDAGSTEVTQAQIDALVADPNFDQGNGQGFWNQVRADAAAELTDWLENDYNGGGTENYLLLGDLNAYAKEDPVQVLTDDKGLTDLIDTFIGQDNAYSFVFDGQRGALDHGLADDSLAAFVTGATEWHINADEPDLLNYDNSFNDDRFIADGPFAASDHDPLIIGLDLDGPDAII